MYIPEKVQFIIDIFKRNNYEAFIVGGSVRDSLLNRKVNDYDIATNALPNIIESLFDKTIPTGIKHGTVTVIIDKESFEITTYRIDGEYINNRKPEEVTFVSDIEKDLGRRDFTINALAYSPYLGFKDYFNGLTDLKNKIIKAVGNPNCRFQEDALRMLRAIRFSSQLNFNIDGDTLEAIKANSNLISKISKERIRDELIKMLLSQNPYRAISQLIDCNIICYTFNKNEISISNLEIALNTINSVENNLIVRLSHFTYYLFNYDLKLIKNNLQTLRFENNIIENVMNILCYKNFFNDIDEIYKLKNIVTKLNFDLTKKILNYNIIEHSDQSLKINTLLNNLNDFITKKEPIFIKDLLINGNDLILYLNIKGKVIGETLNFLLDVVHKNPELNNKETLLKLSKKYISLIK